MIIPKPSTVLELFEGHPERWTRMAMARDQSGDRVTATSAAACRWCLYGACIFVYGHESQPILDRVREEIQSLVGFHYTEVWFNDYRTFEDVVDLVRRAGV